MSDEDIEKRWQEFVDLLRKTNREGIEEVISWLGDKSDFKTAPASTRYHLNCKGGLLEHSLNVYYCLSQDLKPYIELLKIPEDTVILVSLLHDICKANTYIIEMRNVKRDGEWVQEPFYKSDDMLPYGHGEKSVLIIQNRGVKLTALESMMIRWHMGFSDRMPYDSLASDAFTKYPQTLLLHTADVLSTYFVEGNSEGIDKYEKCGFDDLFIGRCATESLKKINEPKSIQTVDGAIYEVAGKDEEVDGTNVILVIGKDNKQYKVYAPYKDGLPF